MDTVEQAAADHNGSTSTQRPPVIAFPAEPPVDVVEMLDFILVMAAKVVRLRDEGSLPRAALTLPERFHPAAASFLGLLRTQATEALGRGEPVVECRLESGPELEELIDWTAPRIEMMDRLVRAGLIVSSWERPFMVLMTFWRTIHDRLRGDGRKVRSIVVTDQPAISGS